jgi:hypothetical protein
MDSESIKSFVKGRLPFAARIYRQWLLLPLSARTVQGVFTYIYRRNAWRNGESLSGPGSTVTETGRLRVELPRLMGKLACHTLLDAACGDFHWMKEVDIGTARYIGVDIVAPIVDANRRRYGHDSRSFLHLDIVSDRLPRADLILCRDCLVHLSNRKAMRALRNLQASGSTYLATTTYSNLQRNEDIATGAWRPLDLTLLPFSLPQPLLFIEEQSQYEPDLRFGKRLGVWRFSDLSL